MMLQSQLASEYKPPSFPHFNLIPFLTSYYISLSLTPTTTVTHSLTLSSLFSKAHIFIQPIFTLRSGSDSSVCVPSVSQSCPTGLRLCNHLSSNTQRPAGVRRNSSFRIESTFLIAGKETPSTLIPRLNRSACPQFQDSSSMAGVVPSFANNNVECGSFFDELFDFPDESGNNNGESGFLGEDFPSIWTQSDMFPELGSVFSGNSSRASSDLSSELALPYEDIAQLEWLSTFVEDSFCAGSGLTFEATNSAPNKVVRTSASQFQMSSPVSVLESSDSSYAGGKVMPVKPAAPKSGRCGRARSKRPRPPTFSPRPSNPLMSPNASFTKAPQLFDSAKSVHSSDNKKYKKIKLAVIGEANQSENPNPASPQVGVRKCQHCEITKTPQWRAGPMGPKTLCNACGVRYKSGRLFPEYRPAASPTFVPSIHSNSHRKVLEIRVKSCNPTGSLLTEEGSSCDNQIELTPNNNFLVDYN